MELIELETCGFRNLEDGSHPFSRAANLIFGTNGAGKTSLLEAIAVLGNLRSFRSPAIRALPRHGETRFLLRGRIVSGRVKNTIEQRIEVGPPVKRSLFIDGVGVDPGRYLGTFPIFAITGSDRDLISRGPDLRRSVLDRFVFLLQTTHLQSLRSYRRALRQRNAALRAGADDRELAAWEGVLAAAAARVIHARNRNVAALQGRFSIVHRELRGETGPKVEIRYRAEPWCDPTETPEKVEERYQKRYNETRTRDRQNGFTGDGPHRHDLSLRAGGRAVRHVLSTGQSKVVAAALRLATLAQVEEERGESFPVIVDDVDAELDEGAIDRLVNHLGGERQIFLSSTDQNIAMPKGISSDRIHLEKGSRKPQEANHYE